MSEWLIIYIPCILCDDRQTPVISPNCMLQWGTVATQKGADAGYALPITRLFPSYAGLVCDRKPWGTSGYNAAMNVALRIASRTHIIVFRTGRHPERAPKIVEAN
ncbi:MAG: hypothetical protein PBU99_07140 [Klebsiella pneumoniae]